MQSFKSVWSLSLFVSLAVGGGSLLHAADRNDGAGGGRKDVPPADADSGSAVRVSPSRLAPARSAPGQASEKSSVKPAAGTPPGKPAAASPDRPASAPPDRPEVGSDKKTPSRVIDERDILWDTEFYVFAPIRREGAVRWPVKFRETYVTHTSRTRKRF